VRSHQRGRTGHPVSHVGASAEALHVKLIHVWRWSDEYDEYERNDGKWRTEDLEKLQWHFYGRR
jgi:hypothetical protein